SSFATPTASWCATRAPAPSARLPAASPWARLPTGATAAAEAAASVAGGPARRCRRRLPWPTRPRPTRRHRAATGLFRRQLALEEQRPDVPRALRGVEIALGGRHHRPGHEHLPLPGERLGIAGVGLLGE